MFVINDFDVLATGWAHIYCLVHLADLIGGLKLSIDWDVVFLHHGCVVSVVHELEVVGAAAWLSSLH